MIFKNKILYAIVALIIMFSVFFNSIEKVKNDLPKKNAFLNVKLSPNTGFTSFYPEKFIKIEKDTILSNGFNVKVKNFSVMDNRKAVQLEDGNRKMRRPILAEIDIAYKNQNILKTSIDEYFLKELGKRENLLLEHAWLLEEASTQDSVTIALSCLEPKTLNRYNVYLQINRQGKFEEIILDRKNS